MATAPKVQTLSQAMAELNPAYAGQQALIQQRQGGLGQKYDAQRATINAERGQGFNAINNQATGRGMSFSGIPLDEQATYLSTKYLPGMQLADYQQNEEGMQLQGQLADINKELRLGAISRTDKQKSDLNSWNQNERNIAAQAEAARLQREFQERQANADRAFQASQASMSRAASAPSGPTNGQLLDSMSSWTKGKVGGDRKLSPSDFKAGYSQWLRAGGPADPGQYTAAMYQYVNNSHAKDYAF